MNDSDEADAVRDLMDEPWRRLSEAEESRVGGLSADLYTIGVDRSPPADVREEHAIRLDQLRDAEDWDGILEFLREHEAALPPADVARLRGICWDRIGEPAVAAVFFHEAARIAPYEPINEVLELKALMAAGQREEAIERAKMIFFPGPHKSAIRLLGASSVLFRAADTPEGIDNDLLHLSIDAAERGLELARHEPEDDILQEMRRSACLRLGLTYFSKGEIQRAHAACQESLELAPDDAESLILLGWIEREARQDVADRNFRTGFVRALDRGDDENLAHLPVLSSIVN